MPALRDTLAQDSRQFQFTGERIEFRLPPDTCCYEVHGTEDKYKRVKTGEIQRTASGH